MQPAGTVAWQAAWTMARRIVANYQVLPCKELVVSMVQELSLALRIGQW